MQQISMFDDVAQGDGTGASQPSAYMDPGDTPRVSRRNRAPSAQQVVDQLRKRVASLTEEFDGQSAIRDELKAHLARSEAGKVDGVWMEALIRMGAIPLEIAAAGDDSEPTYFIEDDGRYCSAICDEIHLHLRDLTEEVDRLGEACTVNQRELDDLLRLTTAT